MTSWLHWKMSTREIPKLVVLKSEALVHLNLFSTAQGVKRQDTGQPTVRKQHPTKICRFESMDPVYRVKNHEVDDDSSGEDQLDLELEDLNSNFRPSSSVIHPGVDMQGLMKN